MITKEFFPIIKTSRFTLRRLVPDDAYELHSIRSNPLVNRYINRPAELSVQDAEKFIDATNEKITNHECIYWAISLNETDKLIGTTCLFNFNKERTVAELGYELLPVYQGRGIMQQAVTGVIQYGAQTLRLQTITAFCKPQNERSLRLLQKNNFVRNKKLERRYETDLKGMQIYSLDLLPL